MAEANQSAPRLTTGATIKLHTEPVNSFIHTQRTRIGLLEFGKLLNRVCDDARHDNPVADCLLVRIEEKMEALRTEIKSAREILEESLKEVEHSEYSVEIATSDKPFETKLRFGSPYPFVVANVLHDLDRTLRIAFAASHVGAISSRSRSEITQPLFRRVRELLDMPRHYKSSKITRKTWGEQDAQTKEAFEERVGGSIPSDVLAGSRRGDLAPDRVNHAVPSEQNEADVSVEAATA